MIILHELSYLYYSKPVLEIKTPVFVNKKNFCWQSR
nr:MAG TPA: hypothetical protein [Caudoviricetes sp.]